ncbi:MAG: M15 family metallopeptidase [Steroidobacteraceae bacterium]
MPEQIQFSPLELTGRSRGHIVDLTDPPCGLHAAVVTPFLEMRSAAAVHGIDLVPVSSFRGFERQLAIWNGKCRGERPLLDVQGQPLDAATLDADALVAAILVWSALPGASRHHWGTDFDAIDRAALPAGYQVQLIPQEYALGGVFERLGQWLDGHAAQFGFYRPYSTWRGGSQPEPWHLSHGPVASQALAQFTPQLLGAALADVDLAARAAVERALPGIFARYVANVDAWPEAVSPATRLA